MRILATAVVVATLVVASCGGDDDDDSGAATSEPSEGNVGTGPDDIDNGPDDDGCGDDGTGDGTGDDRTGSFDDRYRGHADDGARHGGGVRPGADPEAEAVALAWTTAFDSNIDFATKAPFIADADALRPTIDAYTPAGAAVGGIALGADVDRDHGRHGGDHLRRDVRRPDRLRGPGW